MPSIKEKSVEKPALSIIIVSYNTLRLTNDCITSIFESLEGSNLTVEVIVIDNNSDDGSVTEIERLAKIYPSIRLVKNTENTGFGVANNHGVSLATAETILLLNSDTIVLNNAVEKLYTQFQSERYDFLGGRLLNQDMTTQPSCGAFFTLPVVFAFLFLKGDAIGLTRRSPDKNTTTDWMSGACIMCKKATYQALDGFDPGIFMYMEEVDLLYRGKQAGYITGYTPEAAFIHLGSGSSNQTYPILQVYRGLRYFYHKHYGTTAHRILKNMLQLKALISYWIGRLTGDRYLIETYDEAYRIATMD